MGSGLRSRQEGQVMRGHSQGNPTQELCHCVTAEMYSFRQTGLSGGDQDNLHPRGERDLHHDPYYQLSECDPEYLQMCFNWPRGQMLGRDCRVRGCRDLHGAGEHHLSDHQKGGMRDRGVNPRREDPTSLLCSSYSYLWEIGEWRPQHHYQLLLLLIFIMIIYSSSNCIGSLPYSPFLFFK